MSKQLSVDLVLNSAGFKTGIDQAKRGTEAYTNATKLSSNNIKDLNRTLRSTQKEATALAIAFNSLSKAEQESANGKALQRQLHDTMEEAARLKDIAGDAAQQIKAMASDTAGLDAFKELLDIGKDAATAYAGAIAKLTGDEKALKDVIATVTMVQGGFNAAIKTMNALQKQSSLMNGIRIIQTKAAAAAIKLETSATKGATIAQRAFTAVAKANPYVLLATVAIAAATAIGTYMVATRKSREEEEKSKLSKEQLKKAQEAYNNTFTSTATNLIVKYRQLQVEWSKLKSSQEQATFIKDRAKDFEEYGKKIKTVNDANKLLVDDAKAVEQTLFARAQAAAYAAQAEVLLGEAIQEQLNIDKRRADRDKELASVTKPKWVQDGQVVNGTPQWKQITVQEQRQKILDKYVEEEEIAQARIRDLNNKASELITKGAEIYSQIPKTIKESADKTKNEKVDFFPIPNTDKLGKELVNGIKKKIKEVAENTTKEKQKLKVKFDADFALDKGSIRQHISNELNQGLENIDMGKLNIDETKDALDTVTNNFKTAWDMIAKYKKENNQTGIDETLLQLEALRDIYDQLYERLEKLEKKNKVFENAAKALGNVANIAGSVGDLFSAIGDATDSVGAKAAGLVANAIATIALTFAQSLKGTVTPWDWIAASISGAATMASTIAQIKKLTAGSYAKGGVIPGNSYSGDNMIAYTNSGERVLTAEQNENLEAIANIKRDNLYNNRLTVTSVRVSGSDLLLAINNDRQIHGKNKL